jgi:ketosteroid isomerase-like protein
MKSNFMITAAMLLALVISTDFVYEKMSVRLLGNVAIVASIYSQRASLNGIDRGGEFFLTDVWEKRDGRWQVVARYSSRPEKLSESSSKLIER